MEMVLPTTRNSGQRSQEEQQSKKTKNDDAEMNIGKMEDEGVDVNEDAKIEECFAETGRASVGTKWVDVNKEMAENPNIRCRIVAKGRGGLGPLLEAKKVLFSIAATHEKEFREGRHRRQEG